MHDEHRDDEPGTDPPSSFFKTVLRVTKCLILEQYRMANLIRRIATRELRNPPRRLISFRQLSAVMDIAISTLILVLVQLARNFLRFSGRNRDRIQKPPAKTSAMILRFIFPKKAFDTVFAQTIADLREEYFEAISNGRTSKANWILVRDHLTLWFTALAYVAAAMGKKLAGIWKLIP